MNRNQCRGLFGYARLGLALVWHERASVAAKMLLFPLFIGIFAALWSAIAETQLPIELPTKQIVWYLAVTEWILISVPQPEFDLEQQMRSGDIGYQLTRPLSLLSATVAQGLATLVAHAFVFAIAAFASALLFTGTLPEHPRSLLVVAPFALVGMVVLFLFHVALGICAFWFQNIAPLNWIWSKLTFLLGGLMLPLPLYPQAIQRVANMTPFPHLLYGPARLLLDRHHDFARALLVSQMSWLAAAALLTLVLYRAAVNTLTVNGG